MLIWWGIKILAGCLIYPELPKLRSQTPSAPSIFMAKYVSEGETLWVKRTSGRLVPLANVDYEIVKILPGAEKGRLVYIPFIYRKVAKDEI